MLRRCLPPLAALVFVLGIAVARSDAQNTSQVFGRVTDGSGAVLPGVTVTATSTELLTPVSNVTDETGGGCR